MNVVLDTIGGGTLERSYGVLRRGGTLVSIVEPPSAEKARAQGIKGEFFIVEPNRTQLEEIGRLIDTGRLRAFGSSPLLHSGRRASNINMHLHVAARLDVKQPIENDFDVQNHDAGVDVTFRPTESQYSFVLLADRRSLSPRASVRHGKTGDTGDYASGDVEATAFRVACAAIKSSRD